MNTKLSARNIEFTRPDFRGDEQRYVAQAMSSGQIGGDADFSLRCNARLSAHHNATTLVTHSCTAALEMAALLLDIRKGDEIILPSYTFVSTANAFVLRGAIPVFVDIRHDTLNLDDRLLEAAISPRTKAIVVVHYAGVGCAMDVIMQIADKFNIPVIEDAAQGYMAFYDGRPLGTIGTLGTLSFHQTKNIGCGEGGALIVNDATMTLRAQIIREKGTNRTQFLNGAADKYEWKDAGSSFLLGDLPAAVLFAQLESAQVITDYRLSLWERYQALLQDAAVRDRIRLPLIPEKAQHNAHIFHIRTKSKQDREHIRHALISAGILAVTHYVPLHSAPAGLKYGRADSVLPVTKDTAETLLRLPLHGQMSLEDVDYVVEHVYEALKG